MMNKRSIFVVALAVCLAALIATGSLAYFTATKSVTNSFMVASYDPTKPDVPVTPDELFSIIVYETNNDPDGDPTTEKGNTYNNITPADVLSKDPTVKNTGAYSAYARMNVTITNAAKWTAVAEKNSIDIESIFNGISADWTRYDDPVVDEVNDTITYTYYYQNEIKAGDTATLFTSVTIPASFDNEDMANISNFNIIVGADAIQSANTGDPTGAVADAYYAFTNFWDA